MIPVLVLLFSVVIITFFFFTLMSLSSLVRTSGQDIYLKAYIC